jgi:hypothetical protein
MRETRLTKTTPINAATETTTSASIDFEGVRKATWFFTRADHSAGSTAFTVEVSFDGTTWVGYNKLIDNVTNTNVQDLTRVATVTLSSNTTSTVTMDLEQEAYPFVRVTATETTDGTHTAELVREY